MTAKQIEALAAVKAAGGRLTFQTMRYTPRTGAASWKKHSKANVTSLYALARQELLTIEDERTETNGVVTTVQTAVLK